MNERKRRQGHFAANAYIFVEFNSFVGCGCDDCFSPNRSNNQQQCSIKIAFFSLDVFFSLGLKRFLFFFGNGQKVA